MTRVEFTRMLLAHLTVIDAQTQAPAAELSSLAGLWIDGARAELSERGLCWWDEDSIPEAVSIPLTEYVAAKCCTAFGRGGKGYEQFEDRAAHRLAKLANSEERPVVRADYF